MTQLRVKLLVAAVAALAVASSASAQGIRIGGNRGVSIGLGNPGYGNPGFGYGNPGYGYGNPGYGYGNPGYGYGMNSGAGQRFGFNNAGNWNQSYNRGFNQPQFGMYNQSQFGSYNQPQYSGYNQQQFGGYNQAYTVSPGSNYFPATSGYHSNQLMTHTMPTTGFHSYPMQGTSHGMIQQGMVQQGTVQSSGFQSFPSAGVVQTSGFSTDTSSGVVQSGGFTMPQQMSGGVSQASAFGAVSENCATTQVLAPDGATVTLSGVQADRTSGARPFVSPPLEPGKTYTYRARCTWTDESTGKQKVREKSVDVQAGQQVTIDLTRADTDARTNDRSETDESRTEERTRTEKQKTRTVEKETTEQPE